MAHQLAFAILENITGTAPSIIEAKKEWQIPTTKQLGQWERVHPRAIVALFFSPAIYPEETLNLVFGRP